MPGWTLRSSSRPRADLFGASGNVTAAPLLNPPRPASDRRRGVLRHLVDHHARHPEPEPPDRLVGVPLTRIVEADPLPDRHERRRQVSAKDPLLDLLGVARR